MIVLDDAEVEVASSGAFGEHSSCWTGLPIG